MKFLILTHQAEYVNNNQIDKIFRQSSIYAYFFKKYLNKNNVEVECRDLGNHNYENVEADNCLITLNRGTTIIDQNNYNILKSKIKNKIITICHTSSIIGKEDLLLFILGKRKPRSLRINWMADPNYLFPDKDNNKITILVDHKYYGDKNSRIYKLDKTNDVIKSLIEFRKTYTEKEIEILHISEDGINIINDEKQIKEFKQGRAIPYNEIIKYYNTAHIFVNTHYECMGLSLLECAMAGALIVTFIDFMKIEFRKQIHHVHLTDDNLNWNNIIKHINPEHSRNRVISCTYESTINTLLKNL